MRGGNNRRNGRISWQARKQLHAAYRKFESGRVNGKEAIAMDCNPNTPPNNLDEAVQQLIDGMADSDIDYVNSHDCQSTHHALGKYIRDTWRLWERNNKLVQWFMSHLGIAHGDDISGTIIAALWHKVRGRPFDAEEHVVQYKQHWAQAGVNPLEDF